MKFTVHYYYINTKKSPLKVGPALKEKSKMRFMSNDDLVELFSKW